MSANALNNWIDDEDEWDKLNADIVRLNARTQWPPPTESGRRPFHRGGTSPTRREVSSSGESAKITEEAEVKDWLKRAEESMHGSERSSSATRGDAHQDVAAVAALLDLGADSERDDEIAASEEDIERERAKWIGLWLGFTFVLVTLALFVVRAFGAREVVERLRFGTDASQWPARFFTSDPRRVMEWQRRRIIDLDEEKTTLLHRLQTARTEAGEYQIAANHWKDAFFRCVKKQRDACPNAINECPMRTSSPFQGSFYDYTGQMSSTLLLAQDTVSLFVRRFVCPYVRATRDGLSYARRLRDRLRSSSLFTTT